MVEHYDDDHYHHLDDVSDVTQNLLDLEAEVFSQAELHKIYVKEEAEFVIDGTDAGPGQFMELCVLFFFNIFFVRLSIK